MRLNNLKPKAGSRPGRKRAGRGIGSGLGKTSGRGHKGQRSRAGGYHKVGFEGGQMPLQRRLPKRGFRAPGTDDTAQLRLGDLARVEAETIDVSALKAAGLVPQQAKAVKVFLRGEIKRAVKLRGIALSKGAKAAVEAAGGSIE
jgi:large subunit ribosomal protein L15